MCGIHPVDAETSKERAKLTNQTSHWSRKGEPGGGEGLYKYRNILYSWGWFIERISYLIKVEGEIQICIRRLEGWMSLFENFCLNVCPSSLPHPNIPSSGVQKLRWWVVLGSRGNLDFDSFHFKSRWEWFWENDIPIYLGCELQPACHTSKKKKKNQSSYQP